MNAFDLDDKTAASVAEQLNIATAALDRAVQLALDAAGPNALEKPAYLAFRRAAGSAMGEIHCELVSPLAEQNAALFPHLISGFAP